VFSYSHSRINKVYEYIKNQETHHTARNFKDEYIEMLKKFQIKFEEKYLFEWIY
jgi:putative transposase